MRIAVSEIISTTFSCNSAKEFNLWVVNLAKIEPCAHLFLSLDQVFSSFNTIIFLYVHIFVTFEKFIYLCILSIVVVYRLLRVFLLESIIAL